MKNLIRTTKDEFLHFADNQDIQKPHVPICNRRVQKKHTLIANRRKRMASWNPKESNYRRGISSGNFSPFFNALPAKPQSHI